MGKVRPIPVVNRPIPPYEPGKPDPLQLLTAAEVSKLLGVCVQTLAEWRCSGREQLRYVKVGGLVRYFRHDIEDYLMHRCQGGLDREEAQRYYDYKNRKYWR